MHAVLGVHPPGQLEHPARGHLEPAGVEDLRADVRVQPGELKLRQRDHPADRLVGGARGEREAELLVVVRGRHELMRVRLDPGGYPDEDARPDPGRLRVVGKPGDLLKGVDHDVPDASGHRLLDLGGQLVVAVQGDQRRVNAGRQRHREFAAGADVHAEALLGDPAEHGAGAERLGRVVDPRVLAERVDVLARSASHVRLVHDERRRAEPLPPGRGRRCRRASGRRRPGARRAARSPGGSRSGPRAAPAGGRRAARPHDAAQPGGRHGSQRCSVSRGATPVPPMSSRPGPMAKPPLYRARPRGRGLSLFVTSFPVSRVAWISFAGHSRSGALTSSSPTPAARPVRAALARVSLSLPGAAAFPGWRTELSTSTVTPASSSR